jgi:hypothetical protein
MKKVLLFLVMSAMLSLFYSCSDDENENDVNNEVITPATYSFVREGNSTVSYSGQTTRIEMAQELEGVLKDTSKSEEDLDGMFTNTGNKFSDASLNESTKNVRKKVAASKDFFSENATDATAIKGDFDSWIAAQVNEVFNNWDNDASAGVPGKIQESGGGSTRYINSKGLEYNQAIIKSLIGGLMVDQILNNYLSPAVLDEATNRTDNDAGTLYVDSSGNVKDYTLMEHKWDEAFGYLYGLDNATAPELNKDKYLNKYLSRVEGDADFTGIADDIYNAFKLGRAAIVAKNYEVRDAQANILKEKNSEIIGIRAVYYLQQGKNALSPNVQDSFHDLSEGFGFVYSLQFTRKPNSNEPYFTKSEVDGFISILSAGNGFWDISEDALETMSNTIASKFNFTVLQAGS